jgi:hypothetical protein
MNRTSDQLIFFESKESDAARAQVISFKGELVGRVPTACSTQLIDFATNKQFGFLRGL